MHTDFLHFRDPNQWIIYIYIYIYIYIDGLDIPGTNSLSWLSLAMKTPHLPTFATSSPLGSAVALEMAA